MHLECQAIVVAECLSGLKMQFASGSLVAVPVMPSLVHEHAPEEEFMQGGICVLKVIFAWAMSHTPGLSVQQALHAVGLLLCQFDGLSVAHAASGPGLRCCCEPPHPAKHI